MEAFVHIVVVIEISVKAVLEKTLNFDRWKILEPLDSVLNWSD